MTQPEEDLSNLMDGELDAQAMRRAIDCLEADPSRRDTWTRYHLVRQAMHLAHEDARIDPTLADRIHRHLGSATPTGRPTHRPRHALLPWALAASVTVFAAYLTLDARQPVPQQSAQSQIQIARNTDEPSGDDLALHRRGVLSARDDEIATSVRTVRYAP